MSDINWFPGHMAKAKRKIQENLKLVDLVLEVIDARIPISSKNLGIDFYNKIKILVLNKYDISDSLETQRWFEHFKKLNLNPIKISCFDKNFNHFFDFINEVLKEKIDFWKIKGIKKKAKIMVVGIPNVGKSFFINRLTKKNVAKVENKPGVTKKNQWFALGKNFEILDTPGVLWPKLENEIGENLAICGSIKNSFLDIENLACKLLDKLKNKYFENLIKKYDLKLEKSFLDSYDFLEYIGENKKIFMSGENIDLLRVSRMILNDFNSGKLGKISLESVDDLNY
ncbi:MAG: ribosome biogenesis GTPase YlqF [Candidatus Paraimprobicoccus trichonymphae]|uniref:Ribosome biogenesis GTPase A n=1 Tax=Candidatus Paraimprobicoccus trichonymphae TaxID=3033793 RepID=A0AA48KXF0_9FIRM|nr:MAG: ribosome biogenesis GTPase YlqF [Candidatus Paraimprobicoccus trichonymphae]